ncbi:MAG: 30S ribosomal protein S1 [Candidatus Vogelbacteria bacterium CG22_combo_CG10-13_8_21_14_all_37_9]|uniref:30S ribosomal protein S1 n=1 Tax=Candidatus Vogelbacteria bacterium CG22_combo_CG10-13_8_21_14_all_37_9 TaxID=1975046 RepID=A0A2H0BL90_9BACT|nr:MAG: 30S ribosomal protein S1 [Candidatus Vogelbacteria bacterium CG22_combo_CG10-13_8_21_14_all_37_9]
MDTKLKNQDLDSDIDHEELDKDEFKPSVEARTVMEEIVKNSLILPEEGALVEGKVIAKEKLALYIEIPPFGTGLIFGREYLNARDVIKKINIGDLVTAKIVALEGEEGYIELSLKEARQALVWSEAEKAIKAKTGFDLVVKDANKGGLILKWQGIDGFIPASQLKAEHYPRITDGDKDKIAEELQKLVGKMLTVSIITADPKENKLIFSEKSQDNKAKLSLIEKYALGDTVEGEVTGTVDFGIFLKIEDGLEGLVHISEIDWSLVENPREIFQVGEKLKAKIIEIKDDKISLSLKALKPNPWTEAEKKFKRGDVVKGVVIKHNKHGALVSIEEGVAGLVHISEFKNEDDLRQTLELGKTYTFTINLFESKSQKMTLVFGAVNLEEKDQTETKKPEEIKAKT